jgi:hypothetical protein
MATRRNSYEFYEIRTDLAGKNEECFTRGSLAHCQVHFNKLAAKLEEDPELGPIYLVRVTLVEKIKQGE